MNAKFLGLLAFLSLSGLSAAHASTYTYTFDGGDIVLNCDSCNVTSSTFLSWSLGSAVFDGSNLYASSTGITFTPTASTDAIFNGSSGGLFFGSATIVPGGTSSCTPGSSGCTDVGGVGEANPCAVLSGPGGYGSCSFGVLTLATTTAPLIIATSDFTVTPVPAALPLFATGLGGLGLFGWRRKQKAQAQLGVDLGIVSRVLAISTGTILDAVIHLTGNA